MRGWSISWPTLRDAVITFTAVAVVLGTFIVWAVSGRPPDPVLMGFAGSVLAVTGGLAGKRILSTGSRSSPQSSPSSPSAPPSPTPSQLPEAPDAGK